MTEATERNEGGAPYQIDDWLMFPYKYFSIMLGDKSSSLLDLACGNNPQRNILTSHWKTVTSGDYMAEGPHIERMNVLDLPTDKSYDTAFSFETIEHIARENHAEIVQNFMDIANQVVFGTVNLDGPCKLDEHEIWVGDNNPFHVAEYTIAQWKERFPTAEYFQSVYKNGEWSMEPRLTEDGISIFALLKRT